MKKLLGILVLGLLWCNVGFAEMRLIEEKKLKAKQFNYISATFCIDGYKFVIVNKMGKNQSTSIVQAFRVGGTSPNKHMALPAKC